MSQIIVGVDPGKTCGYFILDGETTSSADLTTDALCDAVAGVLALGRPTVVAVERFTFQLATSKMTRQYDALEVIGVLKYLARRHLDTATLVIQGASDAQRLAPRQVLVNLGWWSPGYDHRNKAAAQAALALAKIDPAGFTRRSRAAADRS